MERLLGQKEVEIAMVKKNGRELIREEKMELIKTHADNYGLNRTLEVMQIAKSSYLLAGSSGDAPKASQPGAEKHIREAITDHPDYGWRRLLPEVIEWSGQTVNHKRLRRRIWE